MGFSFSYPGEVQLISDDKSQNADKTADNKWLLVVRTLPVAQLAGSLGYDRATALKDAESLALKQMGEYIDAPLPLSRELLSIDEHTVKKFLVLQRFDVCHVSFEHKILFYKSGHQVIISLNAPAEPFRQAMPGFFRSNRYCPGQQVWDMHQQDDFFYLLKAHKAPAQVQQWHDTFEDVIRSLHIS